MEISQEKCDHWNIGSESSDDSEESETGDESEDEKKKNESAKWNNSNNNNSNSSKKSSIFKQGNRKGGLATQLFRYVDVQIICDLFDPTSTQWSNIFKKA